MIANTLTLRVDRDGRWLRLAGDLNYATVDETLHAVRVAVAEADGPVVLDLSEVALLASMGIEMLLSLLRSDEAPEFVLFVNAVVLDVLTVTGVVSRFTVAKTAAEARELAGLN